jgi:glycerophosphoryl diester phosphodiesterase
MIRSILQLGFAGCLLAGGWPEVSAPLPVSRHPFIVIAHRGNHTRVPENTLAAVGEAIRCDVDYVEIDLRTTKDGYLVLSHDRSVDRMTGGKGNIADLTLAEIKELEVRSPGQPGQGKYRIPEFRDVLRLCRHKVNIYLDFKEADVRQTWRQIRAAGMEKQVVVYLNKPGQYDEWRAVAPRMPLMTSLPGDVRTPEAAALFLREKKIEVLDNVYDTAMLRAVRQQGIAVWLDVQSDKEGPASWEEMLGKEIQGVQTDHPEALMDYLARWK